MSVLDTKKAAKTSPLFVVPVDGTDAARTAEVAAGLLDVAAGRLDTVEWVAAARDAWEELPVALRRSLRRFRRQSGRSGSLILRGLPVDEAALPATPTVPDSVQRIATVPAAILLMIACGIGDPAAYLPEKSGALVQDVVPVPGMEEFRGNAGSVLLSLHNENAFHRHRPDYVMLLCLRPDQDRAAGARIACIREVFDGLDDTTRAALFSPEFVTEAPPSFGVAGDTEAHAVLSGAPDDPDLRVDFDATRPMTPRAGAALRVLNNALAAAANNHPLATGDLTIVDNRVAVHGRTGFHPRYDGRDRWLQRTFVVTSLRRSRAGRPADGHILVD
jgi:L-asparagine oxygenase